MDSSETNNHVIATNLSDSDQLQDSASPNFSHSTDLSPIKPSEGAVVTQSFPELGNSAQVFTPPRINPQSQSSSLERPQYHHSSSAPVLCTPGKLHTDLSYQVSSHDVGQMNNGSALGKGGITTQYVDEYLSDWLKVDSDEAVDAANSSLMHSDIAAPFFKEYAECINYNSINGEQHNAHVRTELQESTQRSQLHTCGEEPAGGISTEQKAMLHSSEVSQQMPGLPRRRLQYDESQENVVDKICGSSSQLNATSISRSFSSETQVPELSSADLYAPPNNLKLENNYKPILSTSHAPKFGRSSLSVSKPLGIGLHLNSIVNAFPMGCGATLKSADKGYMIVQGMKSLCTTNSHSIENAGNSQSIENAGNSHLIENAGNSPTSSKAVDRLLVTTEEMERRSCASTACDERKYTKLSSQKKRKRSAGSSDNDGCKRCNCKKTKCLKLYCDCFASGYYCAETCSCQGCFNTPEYEDTVLEKRRRIVSRDPLAFAPKILQRVGESPANNIQDINTSTPSPVRHKSGCNCKKSMCLKRYCQCYQSNIGCSDGCRCAGCQNVYGKKEECGSSKHTAITEVTNDIPEIICVQKLDTILHSEPSSIPHSMANDTSSQPCPESGSFSSLSSSQLSSPPITSVVPFGENGLPIVLDSDSRCYNISKEDDIPEILKEHPISLSDVKGRSPNNKRVSPPHSRFREIRPGSSITGLKSGRKYILKAVPSFPPLAPCIDVKSTSSPSTNAPDS